MPDESDALDQLSPKIRAFVLAYVLTCNLVGKHAALAVGVSEGNSRKWASVTLKRPEVRAAVDQLLEERIMSATEVEARLGDMARATPDDFFDIDETGQPTLNLTKAYQRGKLHLLKRLKYNSLGLPEIELHDAQAALTTLARRHGLLRDQSTNLNVNMGDLTDEQLQRLAEGEDPLNVLRDRERDPTTG